MPRTVSVRSGIPKINRQELREFRVALPPLPEQQAIAEALADVDALLESIETTIAKKRAIKQGAMQQLLTARTRLPGFVGDWESRTLAEIGECLIGLTYDPRSVSPDGCLVLRSSNIGDRGLQFEDNVFVRMEIPDRIMVREGDLLICVRNGSRPLIGKCALIDRRAEGMTFGAFMAVFRSSANRFVSYCFQSHLIRKQIHEHLGATINQITNKSLRSFRIPFPPLEERDAIAGVLADIDAEIEGLERDCDKVHGVKTAMMQELLKGRVRLLDGRGKEG